MSPMQHSPNDKGPYSRECDKWPCDCHQPWDLPSPRDVLGFFGRVGALVLAVRYGSQGLYLLSSIFAGIFVLSMQWRKL